jgi:DNA-binding NarL/FixJ family response regulator
MIWRLEQTLAADLSNMKRIAALLVEDHTIIRQGLRLLVEGDGDIEIVGEAKTGREAVQMTRDLRPEIIVMDIAMPLLNGVQATRQILKAFPETKVLILSAHSDPDYVEAVVKVGAKGYLVKQVSSEVLATAIRELHKGKTFFTASIAKRLKDEYQKSPNGVGLRKRSDIELTSREAELLQLIAEGHVNKQIASELTISIKTVEKHRQHLMEKLNLHDIASLTRFAIATGIVESSVQSTVA